MIDPKKINDMVRDLLSALPPGISKIPEDLEKNFRVVLQAGFTKLDLVSREEFDAQSAVLLRTREKLEKLEQQLKELEQKQN